MLQLFQTIRHELASVFATPNPLRFADQSQPAPNWFGELEVKVNRQTSGPVLVNVDTKTYEFDKGHVDVSPELTENDKKALRARGLNPDGDFAPAYAAAKRYFAKQPFCKKDALAANSSTEDHPGFAVHTGKDVLAAFNAFLTDKPTF